MMKYIYEFIGTFFLVFTVGMTVFNAHHTEFFAPIAFGSALAVMVYAGGHLSGGHYNPAVSLAVFMRKKLVLKDLWLYWAAQFSAAVVAAFLAMYLKGGAAFGPMELHPIKGLIAEFLFAFALCYVFLNVATVRETSGNSYFGWAIGFTILVGAYAVGAISHGAFNPAVALGITILNLSKWSNIWIYLIANFLGAATAAFVVNAAKPEKERY